MAKAAALAELLDSRARRQAASPSASSIVRFLPGGPQGRPQLHGELFVYRRSPDSSSGSRERTYAAAGVSLATAEGVVERLRAAVESTGARGFGAFAGLHPLDDAAAARGLDRLDRHEADRRAPRGALRACGADMAAHCINDVITTGAEPLILLDYVAANRIDLEQVAELVEGAAEVCRAAGVALIGGETAELPGVYREDELDFAGHLRRHRRPRRADRRLGRVASGDVVVGLPSAGVHANGFTLVRRVLEDEDYDGAGPARADAPLPRRRPPPARPRARLRARDGRRDRGQPRAASLPDGLRAELDWDAWERPPVFDWLARHVDEDELRRVFNLGIGYCAVVAAAGAGRARDRPDRRRMIGVLVSGEGTNLQALLDAGLPVVAVASNRAALRRSRVPSGRRPRRSLRARRLRRAATSATRRWPAGSRSAASSSSSAPATCTCSRRPSSTASRSGSSTSTRRCCPTFPGAHAIEDALAAGVPRRPA